MSIITRYVIRAHLGPFLFSLTALTGLLFLNAVAQRVQDLAGKGLGFAVIGEFMLLSLPHIVALTLPMAILVATLYAFAEMTSNNEVAAMAAGGVHPMRLIVPLIWAGLVFTGIMFVFNDKILPASNLRLSSLFADVGSKSPAFQLDEDVINPIHTADETRYFLRARKIDRASGRLEGITIFDLSRLDERRTIVADRGWMAFTEDQRDLYLTLEDGIVFEVSEDRPGEFQRLQYETQILPLRGVGNDLERQGPGTPGDREMTIAELSARVDSSIADMRRMGEEAYALSLSSLDAMLGAHAGTPVAEELGAVETEGDPLSAEYLPEGVDPEVEEEFYYDVDFDVERVADHYRVSASRWEVRKGAISGDRVEIHKKYAIAIACLIFVLLGPPIGVRFPRGGAGMAIAVSVSIFFLYWVGLIGGERLANRELMPPWLGMWGTNVILTVPALVMVLRLGRSASTNRGGTADELRFRLGGVISRAFGRKPGDSARDRSDGPAASEGESPG